MQGQIEVNSRILERFEFRDIRQGRGRSGSLD